jgi:starvation-inducible DNA-binding protein
VQDNDRDFVAAGEMLGELMDDNKALANFMCEAYELANEHRDVATAGLLETGSTKQRSACDSCFEASRAVE